MFEPHKIVYQGNIHYTVKQGGGFSSLKLLCSLWKWNVTLSPVLNINLITRCCIPEALDNIVRVKNIHNFKLSYFPPGLSISPHTNKYFACGGCQLNIPDKREHTKRC